MLLDFLDQDSFVLLEALCRRRWGQMLQSLTAGEVWLWGFSSLSGLTWTYLPLSIPLGAPLCPLSTRCLLPADLSLTGGRPKAAQFSL